MLIKWYCLLLLTSFILLAELLNCNEKQYEWPNTNPKWCCNRCKPGEHMMTRCTEGGVDTECVSCGDGYYMDEYNYELQCQPCTQCTRDNMELKHDCTKTRNTVCRCQVGFQCNNDQCEQCEKIPRPSTTTITTTTAVTTSTKPKGHTKPFQDSVWISLSLCCACVCILLTCFILISRHTPACGWAISAFTDSCFWNLKKSSDSSECTEEEEVSMPIQEVSGGKTECPEEV
ncbi:tumor necrosis factor receptor superfamily member 6-like [Salminus brasiliensis]|uniref:tumor necrosis factor receptor superfamily member 6-like n=1 Tax=Salminus brasiliensis TaxID=930266 RepID=UPI003B838321